MVSAGVNYNPTSETKQLDLDSSSALKVGSASGWNRPNLSPPMPSKFILFSHADNSHINKLLLAVPNFYSQQADI